MMKCNACGYENQNNAKFCIGCGAALFKTAPGIMRDGRGKYIAKRLIFFGIAIVIGILAAFLLKAGYPGGGMRRPFYDIVRRMPQTLILIIIPLVISFVIAMPAGLAKSNGARNVVRVIATVLRALIPFAFGLVLMDLLAIKLGLLPLVGGMRGGSSLILPLLALTIPLIGFFMNAAVFNGHNKTFGGSVGAVAAWAADKMPVIVIAAAIIESFFSLPGLGNYTIQTIMAMDLGSTVVVLIIYVFIIYILRFLMDVIASAASGGDPSEQVFGAKEPGDRSGKGLLIIGMVCAGLMVLLAIVLPFLSSGNPVHVDMNSMLLAPGEGGYLLGTDQMGRDLFAVVAFGLRNTMIMAFTNTIVACVFGVGFGVAAGFTRGAASEIFKGIRYVFGHCAPLGIILILLMSRSRLPMFFIIGLFGWGGIADRIDNGIKAKRADPSRRSVIILPALEQVVHAFISGLIWVSGASMIGLVPTSPSFTTLGYAIASGRNALPIASNVALWPAGVLMILLFAFFLLHAGLCARERNLKS